MLTDAHGRSLPRCMIGALRCCGLSRQRSRQGLAWLDGLQDVPAWQTPLLCSRSTQPVATSQVLTMAQQPLPATRVDPWHQPILQHRLALMRLSATAAAAATAAAVPSSLSPAARLVSNSAPTAAAVDTGHVQGQSTVMVGYSLCYLQPGPNHRPHDSAPLKQQSLLEKHPQRQSSGRKPSVAAHHIPEV